MESKNQKTNQNKTNVTQNLKKITNYFENRTETPIFEKYLKMLNFKN